MLWKWEKGFGYLNLIIQKKLKGFSGLVIED